MLLCRQIFLLISVTLTGLSAGNSLNHSATTASGDTPQPLNVSNFVFSNPMMHCTLRCRPLSTLTFVHQNILLVISYLRTCNFCLNCCCQLRAVTRWQQVSFPAYVMQSISHTSITQRTHGMPAANGPAVLNIMHQELSDVESYDKYSNLVVHIYQLS